MSRRGWRGRVAAVVALAAAVPLIAAAMPPPAYTGKIWSPFPLQAPASVPGQPLGAAAGAAARARIAMAIAAREPAGTSAPVPSRAPARTAWPAAGSAMVTLARPQAPPRAAPGLLEAAKRAGWAPVTAPRQAGRLPVLVAALGQDAAAAGRVQVTVAGHQAAEAAGIDGVVFTMARRSGAAGQVSVALDYRAMARNIGGAWASRLRLVQLPACALTSPRLPGCRAQRPLRGASDSTAGTVSAAIRLPGAAAGVTAGAGTAQQAGLVVLAAAAGPSGPDGAYTATPLKPSGTWAAQQGDFTYSYPVTVPPSLGGRAPSVALSYDAQSIDSETSAANTQAGSIGDGWDYTPGFIERSYQPCSKDGMTSSGDECWAGYNAVLNLNGQTDVLVGSGPGTWHLQQDNGTSVQLEHGAPNGLWDGEFWVVTAADGTKYYFGQDHLPGGPGSDPATSSAWGTPVYSPAASDPCNSAAGHECQMGWRWNLDYVVDPQQNLTVYDYQAESNYYSMGGGQNDGNGTLTQYTRAGFLTQISYGWLLADAIAGTQPADEIVFHSIQRCTGSATECSSYSNLDSADSGDWPDVPFDQICASTGSCTNDAPTFFTTYMLSKITAQVRAGSGSYQAADSYQLTQTFPQGTGSDSVIYLNSIQRTGLDGGQDTPLPKVSFGIPLELDNRVPGLTPAAPPVDRPRISAITTEAGASISVNYHGGSPCSRLSGGTMPASASANTMPCFPVYWTPPGLSQIQDWFAKSLVSEVDVADQTGTGSDTQVTKYTYLGGAAWHYDDSAAVPASNRTWDQFRGYAQVQVTTGQSPDPLTKTVTTYLRGMNGDNGSTGTITVSDDIPGDQRITDSNWLAGRVLESETFASASATTPDQETVGGPWASTQTADVAQPSGLPDLTADMITAGTTRTRQLFTGGSWHVNTTNDYYNSAGQLSAADSAPDGGQETCTTTTYATAPAASPMMIDYPREVTEVTGAYSAGACPARTAANIVSYTQNFYDDESASLSSMGALGTLTSPGGLLTGVRKAATWPSGGSETLQAISATHYDAYGRATYAEDGDANVTTTAYTPAYKAGSTSTLPTEVDVTAPVPAGATWVDITKTAMDQGRQLPVKVTDPNGEITTQAYDGLGRLSSVTVPADQSAGHATYTYAYAIPQTSPASVTTRTLREDGSYSADIQLYDGMLQLVQEQQTPGNSDSDAAAGRMITTTSYDSHGWPATTTSPYYDASTAPDTTFSVTGHGSIPAWTQDSYDGQGRITESAFNSGNALQWQTGTAYPGMNETDVTPPAGGGGTATSAFTNALGQTTASWRYATTAVPDGIAAAADVTSYTYTPAGQVATVADSNANTWTYAYNLLGQKTSATDPGSTGSSGPSGHAGQSSWTYDGNGNILSATSPSGQELSWTYDALGRKTAEFSGSTSGTKLASWAYDQTPLNGSTTADALGQPTSSTSFDAAGNSYTEKVTGYDTAYQATGTATSIPASALVPGATGTSTYTTASAFTPLTGLLASTAYSADGGLPAETVNYSYDLQGNLLASGGSTAYLDQAIYSPFGQVQRTTFGLSGKQLVQTYTDDADTQRLLQTTTSLQTLPSAADTTYYTYNQAGDITSASDAQDTGGTSTACYADNNLQELTSAWTDKGGTAATAAAASQTTLPAGGIGTCTNTTPSATALGGPAPYWEAWTYDALGDRLTQTSFNTAGTTADNITQTFTYPGSGTSAAAQPDAPARILTQYGTTGSSTTTTPAYNSLGQETGASATTAGTSPPASPDSFSALAYDAQGQVATAKTTAGTSSYTYDASGNLLLQADPGSTVLYLDGGAEQLTYTTSAGKTTGLRFYPSPDGTTVARSSSGTISYETTSQQGTALEAISAATLAITRRYYDPYGSSVGTRPAWPDADAFLGKPADPATSLDLIGARQYNPAVGSFTSLDPVFEAGDPAQMGGYAYAADNPATSSDPTGLLRVCPAGSSCNGTNPGSGPSPSPSPSPSPGPGHGSGNPDPGSSALPPASRSAYGTFMATYKGNDPYLSSGPQFVLTSLAVFCDENAAACPQQLFGQVIGDYEGMGSAEIGIGGLAIGAASLLGSGEEEVAGTAAEQGHVSAIAQADLDKLACGQSFTAATLVLLADGKARPISQLQPGEKILATDTRTGKTMAIAVAAVLVRRDHDLYDLTVRAGNRTAVIHTTARHLFWDQATGSWVRADALRRGDQLRPVAGNAVRVTGGQVPKTASGDMWDLTVPADHDFYVDLAATAVLVHNDDCGMPGGAGRDTGSLKATVGAPENSRSGWAAEIGERNEGTSELDSDLGDAGGNLVRDIQSLRGIPPAVDWSTEQPVGQRPGGPGATPAAQPGFGLEQAMIAGAVLVRAIAIGASRFFG